MKKKSVLITVILMLIASVSYCQKGSKLDTICLPIDTVKNLIIIRENAKVERVQLQQALQSKTDLINQLNKANENLSQQERAFQGKLQENTLLQNELTNYQQQSVKFDKGIKDLEKQVRRAKRGKKLVSFAGIAGIIGTILLTHK